MGSPRPTRLDYESPARRAGSGRPKRSLLAFTLVVAGIPLAMYLFLVAYQNLYGG